MIGRDCGMFQLALAAAACSSRRSSDSIILITSESIVVAWLMTVCLISISIVLISANSSCSADCDADCDIGGHCAGCDVGHGVGCMVADGVSCDVGRGVLDSDACQDVVGGIVDGDASCSDCVCCDAWRGVVSDDVCHAAHCEVSGDFGCGDVGNDIRRGVRCDASGVVGSGVARGVVGRDGSFGVRCNDGGAIGCDVSRGVVSGEVRCGVSVDTFDTRVTAGGIGSVLRGVCVDTELYVPQSPDGRSGVCRRVDDDDDCSCLGVDVSDDMDISAMVVFCTSMGGRLCAMPMFEQLFALRVMYFVVHAWGCRPARVIIDI